MNIEGWQQHRRGMQERSDPYCLAYIESQAEQLARDGAKDHNRDPDIELRSTAELERLWGRVAMAVAGCERELQEMADTQHDLIHEQRECLREAAAALQPHANKAMHQRTTHGEHFRVLFDQHERARS